MNACILLHYKSRDTITSRPDCHQNVDNVWVLCAVQVCTWWCGQQPLCALVFSHSTTTCNGLMMLYTPQQYPIYNKSLTLLQSMNWRLMSNTSMFRPPQFSSMIIHFRLYTVHLVLELKFWCSICTNMVWQNYCQQFSFCLLPWLTQWATSFFVCECWDPFTHNDQSLYLTRIRYICIPMWNCEPHALDADSCVNGL